MMTDPKDDGLDGLFAAARDDRPSPDLTARVLHDARGAQQDVTGPVIGGRQPGGWMSALLDGLGGWPGLSGVTAAGVVGLGIGLLAPDLLETWSVGPLWSASGDATATPDIGALWTEVGDV